MDGRFCSGKSTRGEVEGPIALEGGEQHRTGARGGAGGSEALEEGEKGLRR